MMSIQYQYSRIAIFMLFVRRRQGKPGRPSPEPFPRLHLVRWRRKGIERHIFALLMAFEAEWRRVAKWRSWESFDLADCWIFI